jgi:thymidine kinase
MSITLIIGPMFSGKTSEVIRLIDRDVIAGKRCVIIKHEKDNRFDAKNGTTQHLTSHNNHCYTGCPVIYFNELSVDLLEELIKKYDTVAIEEGHFFRDIDSFCIELANSGLNVIVSALDSSFKQKLFPEIGELIANAERVIKLDAICMRCKGSASFNIRTIESDEDILVGGTDIYQSVCRKCMLAFRLSKIDKKLLNKSNYDLINKN